MTTIDADAAEFELHRPRLFGLAYRLLGSAQEAEDVVQDAYLRWSAVPRDTVATPPAWLAKVVTNLALNRLTSARARRETYVGSWLPEPVPTGPATADPAEAAQLRDGVSYALLVLLERLTPAERAVFVLREAFGHSYREIGEIVELSEANCRQLHHRGRGRVAQPGERFRPAAREVETLLAAFLTAAREGDLPRLEQMFAADVVAWSDGGGRVSAALRPVHGCDRVVRFLAGVLRRFAAGQVLTVVEINGEPALAGQVEDRLVGLTMPEIDNGVIRAVRYVANPDKLRYAARRLGLTVAQ